MRRNIKPYHLGIPCRTSCRCFVASSLCHDLNVTCVKKAVTFILLQHSFVTHRLASVLLSLFFLLLVFFNDSNLAKPVCYPAFLSCHRLFFFYSCLSGVGLYSCIRYLLWCSTNWCHFPGSEVYFSAQPYATRLCVTGVCSDLLIRQVRKKDDIFIVQILRKNGWMPMWCEREKAAFHLWCL